MSQVDIIYIENSNGEQRTVFHFVYFCFISVMLFISCFCWEIRLKKKKWKMQKENSKCTFSISSISLALFIFLHHNFFSIRIQRNIAKHARFTWNIWGSFENMFFCFWNIMKFVWLTRFIVMRLLNRVALNDKSWLNLALSIEPFAQITISYATAGSEHWFCFVSFFFHALVTGGRSSNLLRWVGDGLRVNFKGTFALIFLSHDALLDSQEE